MVFNYAAMIVISIEYQDCTNGLFYANFKNFVLEFIDLTRLGGTEALDKCRVDFTIYVCHHHAILACKTNHITFVSMKDDDLFPKVILRSKDDIKKKYWYHGWIKTQM